MEYVYRPQGVCSTQMVINVYNDIVKDIKIRNYNHHGKISFPIAQ